MNSFLLITTDKTNSNWILFAVSLTEFELGSQIMLFLQINLEANHIFTVHRFIYI